MLLRLPAKSAEVRVAPRPRTTESSIVIDMDDSTSRKRKDDEDALRLVALLGRIGRQDRRAFEHLYDATHQKVFGLAMRITQQAPLAEEVTSDVFMQVWRDAARYDATRGRVLAWMMTICRSRALDAVRKRTASHERDRRGASDETDDHGDDMTQDLLLAVERKSMIHNALLQLDPQKRQLIALAYFRGFSHGQIARATGLPIGTVKTQIRRSLLTLRARLTESAATRDRCAS